MGKWCADAVLDAALNYIKNNANLMTVCTQQPANRTEAVTTYALADVAMASGDFTVAAGSQRKVTVAQKTGVTVDTTGTGNHVALVDATNLIYVTTATSQALTQSNTMTFNSWQIEIGAPS